MSAEYFFNVWTHCEVCGSYFNLKVKRTEIDVVICICEDCMDKIDEELKEGVQDGKIITV